MQVAAISYNLEHMNDTYSHYRKSSYSFYILSFN